MQINPRVLLTIVSIFPAALLLWGCTPQPVSPPADLPTEGLVVNTPASNQTPTFLPSSTITSAPSPTPTTIPKMIAFLGSSMENKNTLYIMDEDGSQVYAPYPELTQTWEFKWSPDGQWLSLLVSDGGSLQIRIFDPLTKQEFTIPQVGDQIAAVDWIWAADSKSLAFIHKTATDCDLVIYTLANGMFRNLQAFVCRDSVFTHQIQGWTNDGRYVLVDVNSGPQIDEPRDLTIVDVIEDRLVTTIEELLWYSAVSSPDNAYLAIGSGRGVEIVDLRSGSLKNFTEGKFIVRESKFEIYTVLTWLPDGRIMFAHQDEAEEYTPVYWYLSPADGERLEQATDVDMLLAHIPLASIYSYQLHFARYAPVTKVLPIQADSIRERLPTGMRLVQYAISPDQKQVLIYADNSLYLLDWESGKLSAPLAEGRWPTWQPGASIVDASTTSVPMVSNLVPTYTPTPDVPVLDSTKMFAWDVWVSFNPEVWDEITIKETVGVKLVHRTLASCWLEEQGPTEYPPVTQTIDLGAVSFKVSERFFNNMHADWYLATRGPDGPFAGGLPTLILIGGTGSEWDTCQADAKLVLATMSETMPAMNISGSVPASGFTCADSLPSRLDVDGFAYVSLDPPLANRVRSGAGTSFPVIGNIQPGKAVKILGGPKCANAWVWWQVVELETGLTGWTVEGDDQDYWLIPCASEEECIR